MAGRPLDHLVLVVPDLDPAARVLADLGFRLTPESHHPFGTSNRLVMVPGCYVEVVTVTRPHLVPETGFAAFVADCLSRDEPGLRMLALRSDDPARDRARLVAAGLSVPEPLRFGREAVLPDGQQTRVEFVTVLPPPPTPSFTVFYCHHLTPDQVWHPALLDHPNRVESLSSVTIGDPGPAGWDRLALLSGAGTGPPGRLGSVVIRPGSPGVRFSRVDGGDLEIDVSALVGGGAGQSS